MLLFLYFLSTKCFFCFFSLFFQVWWCFLGRQRMWPYLISSTHYSQCVRVCVRACVCVDMSVYCLFKFQNAHSHTRTRMHTAKTDSACLSHSQPWLQAQMWRTFLFLLCFIHVHWLSLWVSTRCRNTRVLFVSCHRLGLHTLPRGALVHEGRPKQTQIESMICAWLFHVFYLTFKQIAFHVRNIYCEGLLMCMSNYF